MPIVPSTAISTTPLSVVPMASLSWLRAPVAVVAVLALSLSEGTGGSMATIAGSPSPAPGRARTT
ncbi:hypothetical protein [Nannocystis pusilla]|uniref:hypothetical protein n=1 Tax=Nannocystis pusilla TaxID=889268 RepID=UPI003B79A7BA